MTNKHIVRPQVDVVDLEKEATSLIGLANALILLGSKNEDGSGFGSAVEELGTTIARRAARLVELSEVLDTNTPHRM